MTSVGKKNCQETVAWTVPARDVPQFAALAGADHELSQLLASNVAGAVAGSVSRSAVRWRGPRTWTAGLARAVFMVRLSCALSRQRAARRNRNKAIRM